MTAFNKAFDVLISEFEGLYSNDPNDAGGETVYGIARKRQPHWPGWVTVDQVKATGADLTKTPDVLQEAKGFYMAYFWDPLRCDELPWPVALVLFDSAVNMGTAGAMKLLQEALNQNGADLKVDGVFGKKTLVACLALSPAQAAEVAEDFLVERIAKYAKMRDFNHFGRGWIRRALGLRKLIRGF